VLGETSELGVRTRRREDLSVACRDRTTSLALKRTRDHRCATGLLSAVNDLIDKGDKIVGQPNGDLFAHTKMVPGWDRPRFSHDRPRYEPIG
jgi:hypothetical protein